MNRHILTSTLFVLFVNAEVFAQSGTNSPYSRFGLGKIAEQSIGMSRGMNGVGVALREHGHVNYLNPSSYSAIDSLTFIFDVGLSLQNTNFKENGVSKNAKNGDFEYAVGGFRALRHFGMAFGIMPYTNVGYNYSSKPTTITGYTMAPSIEENTTMTNTYSGSGGLHQFFIGMGWEPCRNFSIGMNVNYLFGELTNNTSSAFSYSNSRAMSKSFTTEVKTVKFDIGTSYTLNLKNKNSLTFGLTYTPGYKINADEQCVIITRVDQSSVADTTVYTAANATAIPTQWAFGLSYKHAKKWIVGLDYSLQRWSSIKSVAYTKGTDIVGYTDSFNDRHSIKIGAQYCQNEASLNFSDRLRYRFGLGYTSSYLKINGQNGPSEINLCAGIGIPIQNRYNNRSVVNVALQLSRASAKNMITENTFLLNIGITFNENWFAKWKFD